MGKAKKNLCVTLRQSELRSLQKKWTSEATTLAMASVFTVLHDREGYGGKRLKRVWDGVEKLMAEVYEGRVNVYDLKKTLFDELGVVIEKE